jgi:hypothetical protein
VDRGKLDAVSFRSCSECCVTVGALTLFLSSAAGCGRIRFETVPTTDSGTPVPAQEGGIDAGPVRPIELDGGMRPLDGGMQQPDATSVVDASLADAAMAGDADTDADTDADASDGSLSACGGSWIIDACWYLADYHTSCDTTCQGRGDVDHAGLSRVGTSSEGGTQENCRQVLTSFGKAAPTYSFRHDGLGFGCHAWMDGSSYWSDDPTPHFDSSFSGYSVTSMVCACNR